MSLRALTAAADDFENMQLTMPLISRKELRHTWSDHVLDRKTMRKKCRVLGLLPVSFDGLQSLYDTADVARAKALEMSMRYAQLRLPRRG